jgi:hypothetical protein
VLAVSAASSATAGADISGAGPDETISQAYGPLRTGGTYSGAFASQSDVDYLAFTVGAPQQTLMFTVRNTTQGCRDPYDAGCPVYATVMDSTGQNQVGGSNSDAGTIATYGDTESFAWTFAQPGTYYVLMESDGDPPPGSPSYSVGLSAATGAGGVTGGGSSGGSGGGGSGGGTGGSGSSGAGGGTGSSSVLVRSLKVVPHQRGKAVTATLVLGRPAARLLASLLVIHPHRPATALTRRLYGHLARGTHHLVISLPPAYRRKLARGLQVSLLLRITIGAPGGQRTYIRRVTLRP